MAAQHHLLIQLETLIALLEHLDQQFLSAQTQINVLFN